MKAMWGVEIRHRTVRHTEFVCPRCGVDRAGREVEPKRWFRVAGVSMIPLATLPTEIVCDTCDHRTDVGVLDIPTTTELTAYLADGIRSSIAFIARSGRTNALDFSVNPSVIEAGVAAMHSEGHAYDELQLRDDVARLGDDLTRASLRRLADELTAHGKQSFLQRMAAIATAAGPLRPRQQRALIEIGASLGMAAPHINGVLAVAALEFEAA